MDNPAPPLPPRLPRPAVRRGVVIALASLALAAGGGFWWYWHGPPPGAAPTNDSDDPRLTYPTRYRNVRPEVQYVGDTQCADCHRDLSGSYHRHPMGRSLAPARGPRAGERPDPARFDALGLSYAAEWRGNRLLHRESIPGPGELHVRRRRGQKADPGDGDDTIVNPRRLEPALREAVCEQCHLQGQARVLRRGRGPFDYRPACRWPCSGRCSCRRRSSPTPRRSVRWNRCT
jgi:hypothetical protein